MLSREKCRALLLNDFSHPARRKRIEEIARTEQDQACDTEDKIIRQRIVTIHLTHYLEIELFF